MKEEFVEEYIITNQTMAVFPNYHPVYMSKILEKEQTVYCHQTPNEIMDASCIRHGSSFSGRRSAMEKMLHTNTKLPIPVDPTNGIYLFPTCSHKNSACIWIAFFHVEQFKELKETKGTSITFSNGSKVKITMSDFSMKRQMQLTGMAIAKLYKPYTDIR
ncbi:hypothetical protein N781_01565 [Pontibacillus halophilus JSM 076056 = DSM 19796]|uniref:Competence protein n=1 Tax=Pontibacillus halophilus JSM 076056 = DSM 19796 TaxID=1385510 RepID=A0A0A5GQ52_9BACI|nr:competence protein ComK [Pontibacillus halophilus]KGX94079.1 hypothetical protein N781_01565 [Pontibacillus halophilus JSM 076056 = DSM 19796]